MFSFIASKTINEEREQEIHIAAQNAIILLKTKKKEDKEKAIKIINYVLDSQITEPDSELYGLWCLKEFLSGIHSKNYDKNSTTFIGIPLFILLSEYSDDLPDELIKKIEYALSIACIFILNRNIHLQYSHIVFAECFLTAACGERFHNPEFTDYALDLYQHFYHYTMTHGSFTEFNASRSDRNNLFIMHLVKRYVKNKLFLQLNNIISDSLWEVVATLYHYSTGNIAGPQQRFYEYFIDEPTRDFYMQACTNAKKKNDELSFYDICPQKYRPYFNGTKHLEFSQKIISQGSSYPYYLYSNVATTLIRPHYCIGSFSRSECWMESAAFLGYFGTKASPFAIRFTAIHDDHDYSSAQLLMIQHMNYITGHTSFAVNRGDRHIDHDNTNGIIQAKNLRLRFLIAGDVSKLNISQNKNTLNVCYDNVHIKFSYTCAYFDRFKPSIELTKDKQQLYFDLVLYKGKSRKINFNELKKAIISWSFCISDTVIPEFSVENSFEGRYLVTKSCVDKNTHIQLESYYTPDTHENIHANNKQYINGTIFEKYVLRNSNTMRQYSNILSNNSASTFNLKLKNEENITKYVQELKEKEEKDIIPAVKEIFSLIYKNNLTLMLTKRLAIQIISYTFDFYREKNLHFETIILNNSQLYQLRISSATDTETVAYHVFELLKLLHSNYVSLNKSHTDINLIKQITELIDEEYSNPDLSREYIAEKCGKSVFAVSRAFKKISNLKYIDYLTDVRIKYAKEYLKNQELSLEEIALKVGYLNLSSFIRTFKKRTGETPSQYRKTSDT